MGKLLITGGAGFIGSRLAKIASNDGWEVCILDNLSTGLQSNA
ncbi:MAG: NAD-dependent epimerase/dehydratase family protein, partial [Candidatus Thermoplasmatota archaeon]|nr:NAD-dependent epimerase/dehydratase family protein [Candidatus Thermoplasmatota archaeon]